MKCENCDNEHDGSYGSGRFCSVKCARSFSTKNKRKELNEKVSFKLKGRKLTEEHKENISSNSISSTEEVKNKISNSMKKYYENNDEARRVISERMMGREVSFETREKLSKIAIENHFGGTTQSRWIKYNGKTLGSSYELELVEDLDKNNIKWDTCDRFRYIDINGKDRTYRPDIYLIDYDIYLDPKNDFLIENINPNLGFKDSDKIKWTSEQNDIKIFILNKDQLNWNYIKNNIL